MRRPDAEDARDAGRVVAAKQLWTGRVTQVAARYGDHAPMASVCCNACRACATTNVVALATGAVIGVAYTGARWARRLVTKPRQGPGGTSLSR